MSDFFKDNRPDGTSITGVRGANWHVHDYGTGVGHIRIQQGPNARDRIPFNNSNQNINDMLPDWMKK